MFGRPKDGATTNTALVLDVRNISSLAFSETYPLTDLDTNTVKSDVSPGSHSEGISTGAIVGIVIGVIAVVCSTLLTISEI